MPKLVSFHETLEVSIDKKSWQGTRKATPAERHEYFNKRNVSPSTDTPAKGKGAKPKIKASVARPASIWEKYKIEPPKDFNAWLDEVDAEDEMELKDIYEQP